MDNPTILLPSTPQLLPKGHTRTVSRSPTRTRLMDDMLADLSPATTLEAFTSVSGTLKASIEAASPTQRAFGIRAAIASKKIQEWMTELSAWPWPTNNSDGFEIPIPKRRKINNGNLDDHKTEEMQGFQQDGRPLGREEYWGYLPAAVVRLYESRIDEISEDMDDLNVEEIKSQVLDRHILPRSRASSLSGPYINTSASQSYTRIDDFTAVVTATVLQALPSLSRLLALMDVWSVRLSVLRQVSPLMASMEDAEVAIKSGWKAIQTLEPKPGLDTAPSKVPAMSRLDYEIVRDVLQEKVSKLGQKLDHMLDTLEGRNDTLPEAWLDRMESIEQDYGEWVVCGERKVSEDEWATESAARPLEKLRRSSPATVDPPRSDSNGENVGLEHEDKNTAPVTSMILQIAGTVPTEPATLIEAQSLEPETSDIPDKELQPQYSKRFPPDTLDDGILLTQASNDVKSDEKDALQLTESAKSMQSHQRDVGAEEPYLTPEPPLPLLLAKSDPPAHQEEIITDLASLSDGMFEVDESKKEFLWSDSLSRPAEEYSDKVRTVDKDEFDANRGDIMKLVAPATVRQILMTDINSRVNGKSSDPPESSPSRHSSPTASPADTSTNEDYHALPYAPSNSSKIPSLGHPLTNSLRREMPLEVPASPSPRLGMDSRSYVHKSNATIMAELPEPPLVKMLQTPPIQAIEVFPAQQHTSDEVSPPPPVDIPIPELSKLVQPPILNSKPSYIDLPKLPAIAASERKPNEHLSPDVNSPDSFKGHTRGPSSASIISGYATSEPSPVIHEAEPTEYFRPDSPPIIAKLPDLSTITTPTRTSFNSTSVSAKTPQSGPGWEPGSLKSQGPPQPQTMSLDSHNEEDSSTEKAESESSGNRRRRRPVSNDSVISVIRTALGQGRTSQEGSVSSDVSTINERLNSVSSTPVRMESPAMETVPRSWHSQFVSNYDGDSPSLGRVRLHNDANTYSPASSPPPETPPSERRPLQLHKTPSFDPDSFYPDSPATSGEHPDLGNVELSPTPALSSPSNHSDDQLQQQISEILESIPARIRLTSEPNITSTSSIKPTKKRISLNPFSRPASRAATPSFTLAPAYARNPRPRPQNGNPEIKLYHLSRSTGESPIKLFVRLVGENGERVMVRVGGGWADLGEYLKEYASHHGRRSDQPGKVEIQDLPPRVVSTGSTASTSTLRNGTWNTSDSSSPASRPGSRPGSAFGRPLSSLAIRKTRKSVGEEAREIAYRSPSTPLSAGFRSSPQAPRSTETPPHSANSGRSVSQMSWREDESSLGLAGPRSRKGEISAENAAWVESMKEKVRIASAEKEKKEKATFGDMGQVGATKRLFKKSG